MITFLSLLILLSAFLLLLLKKPKAAWALLSIFTIIFILQGSGVIANFLLISLQSPYEISVSENPIWQKTNLIIVLGGGTNKIPNTDITKPGIIAYSRIIETAQLYFSCRKSGKQCQILASGADVYKTGASEAKIFYDNLIALGVKEEDIILESNSRNTYQNAQFCAKILKEKNYDQLLLVTSGFHLKRSLLYFSKFNLYPLARMSDYTTAQLSLKPIGYNFAMADLALHEYEGMLYFYIYEWMGWNREG